MIVSPPLRCQGSSAALHDTAVVDKITQLFVRWRGDALEHAGLARWPSADKCAATTAPPSLEQTTLARNHQGAPERDGGDSKRLGQANLRRQLISGPKQAHRDRLT